MADFHEKLHNELTQGTFVGFAVSEKGTSQSFPGASGYLAGYGPFTMTDSSPEECSSGNYEVFYNKNSRSFIDKNKCINIPLNWTLDGQKFTDPHNANSSFILSFAS